MAQPKGGRIASYPDCSGPVRRWPPARASFSTPLLSGARLATLAVARPSLFAHRQGWRRPMPINSRFLATQQSARFGYTCNRCKRCCTDKRIQVNPSEVARLARNRAKALSSFARIGRLAAKEPFCARKKTWPACFLGPGGCEVHADRPLACRLYPLGRHIMPDGSEYFTVLEGHPQSAGRVPPIAARLRSSWTHKAHGRSWPPPMPISCGCAR